MIVDDLRKALRQNIRDYGMYIALFVIMAIFTVATKGIFISSRNIANLMNQTGYIAVLAVGMTLVIVIRHIDLSVGFLAGFLGAIAAVAMVTWKLPVFAAIPIVLALGAIAGLITAYPVAKLGVPSFVASLAGWLIYRGALLLVTSSTGTIIIPNAIFNAIGNGYIPDILPADALIPGVHKLTLLIGMAVIGWFIANEFKVRRNKKAYGFEIAGKELFALKLVFISIVLGLITWVLAGYNGLSWTLVIVMVVVMVYNFVAQQTVLGRHIYAVGGNPEAAELSGISVKRITFIVFGSMGMLSGISGILFASRLQSATPTAGTLFELDAVAAAYIGGVSASGGVGKISGSLIGALVYMSLMNGMNLLNTDISLQYIIRGAVLAGAVIFDVATRRRKA
jgi:putative multiple sugar transport system permease protein